MTNALRLVLGLSGLQKKKHRYIFCFTLASCALFAFLQFQSIILTRDVGILLNLLPSQASASKQLFIGILKVLSVSLLASAIQLLVYFSSNKWSASLGEEISKSLFKKYIYSPYSIVTKFSVSNEISLSVTQLNQVVTGIVFQIFPVISALFSIAAVLISLIFSFGQYALIILFLASIPGFLYSSLVKSRIKHISKSYSLQSSNEMYLVKSALESKGEIDILGIGHKFLDAYSSVIHDIRVAQGNARLFDQLLKPMTEGALLLVAIVLLGFSYYSYGADSVGSIISQALVYLVSFSKLFPASSIISKALNSLRICNVPLSQVVMRLESLKDYDVDKSIKKDKVVNQTVKYSICDTEFNKPRNISSLKILKMSYGVGSKTYRISDLSFAPGLGFYCITGESGVGKTSFFNAICSLIHSDSFDAQIVLTDMNNPMHVQPKSISCSTDFIKKLTGYSFQHPYIFLGKSLLYNITFCDYSCDIDWVLLSDSFALAGLSAFAPSVDSLANISLGGDGIKLSGGQLKRLGLARSIYFSKGIILLDECTSGLDYVSESHVIEALNLLSGSYIVIAATHSARVVEAAGTVLRVQDTIDSIYTIS